MAMMTGQDYGSGGTQWEWVGDYECDLRSPCHDTLPPFAHFCCRRPLLRPRLCPAQWHSKAQHR